MLSVRMTFITLFCSYVLFFISLCEQRGLLKDQVGDMTNFHLWSVYTSIHHCYGCILGFI